MVLLCLSVHVATTTTYILATTTTYILMVADLIHLLSAATLRLVNRVSQSLIFLQNCDAVCARVISMSSYVLFKH